MTIQQLACFLEVVRCNSFSTAASRLFYSQPTLSRQISMLEEELGIPLFVRSQNTVFLTAPAEAILPEMQKLYTDFLTTEKKIHAKIANFSDHLFIGIQEPQTLDDRTEAVLHQFRQRFPKTTLKLQTMDIRRSSDALNSNEIDCLLYLGSTLNEQPMLRTYIIRQDEMCLAVPASHPNAGLRELSYSEVKDCFPDLPLTFMDINHFGAPPSPHLKEVRDTVIPEGATFLSDAETQMNSLRVMVEQGLCISVFNEHSLLAQNPKVKLIPLVSRKDGVILRHYAEVGFAWDQNNQNPALKLFLDMLLEAYAKA